MERHRDPGAGLPAGSRCRPTRTPEHRSAARTDAMLPIPRSVKLVGQNALFGANSDSRVRALCVAPPAPPACVSLSHGRRPRTLYY